MPAPIDATQVRHIARLARLHLSENEVQQFAEQLGDILDYFQKIDEVDTAGVEPMAHPLPVTNVLRDDAPAASYSTEQALNNAPQREGDFFRVPKVLDQGA